MTITRKGLPGRARCRCGVCKRFLSCDFPICACGKNEIDEGKYRVDPCDDCYEAGLDYRNG